MPMLLSINNLDSAVQLKEVFVFIAGTVGDKFAFFNFANNSMVFPEIANDAFPYVSGTVSHSLDKISFPISLPAIKSGRIYFAIGTDFPDGPMLVSGPSASKVTATLFDKVEFDSTGDGPFNINTTSVDFYGVSLTITAKSKDSGELVTFGYKTARGEIINAFRKIVQSPPEQHAGNTSIFADTLVLNGDAVHRVLSPASMALSDWTTVGRATLASHFLDAYITELCWKPKRVFTFFDKLFPSQRNQRFGRVTEDGMTVELFIDEEMTQVYSPVPRLPRPTADFPSPDFSAPSNYHKTAADSVNGIDWGFLLLGNASGGGSAAEAWGGDPAVIAILVSICRGVMHLDDGTTSWVAPKNYYPGLGGASTPDRPIYFYAKLLHHFGANGRAYVLSFDDVYGQNTSIFFNPSDPVTITLHSLS